MILLWYILIPAVAAPLTAGVFRSRILLPSVWRDWPAEKLRAVLAHETAHVRRRDAIPALLAQVNRCLFWFHPLAWWLERAITATAEQAADEAVIQATGARRAYAEVLIEMAGEVRRRGGLRAAQALSMDGGALERRIDSILFADSVLPMSRRRKAVVAVACAASIFLAAACRQKSDVALVKQAESRDQDYKERVARRQAARKAAQEFLTAASKMTSEQAAALESGLKTNPDDLEVRKKLIAYYGGRLSGTMKRAPQKPPVIDYAAAKAALAEGLPHYFWLVEHHPEVLMVDSKGRKMQHGSREHACWSSATYRQYVEKITAELGRRFGRNTNVWGWQLDNELSHYGKEPDFSAPAQKNFWWKASASPEFIAAVCAKMVFFLPVLR